MLPSSHETLAASIFKQSQAGVALCSGSGEWLRLNPAFCAMLGRSEEELLGRAFHELTHADDLKREEGLVQQTWQGKQQGYTIEKRFIREDGSVQWVLVTVSLFRGEDGAPCGLSVVAHDLSAQRQVHHLRHESARRLGNALRERDEWIALASHELKVPITAISLQAGLLARLIERKSPEAYAPARVERMVRICRRQIDRLDSLVNALLDGARFRGGPLLSSSVFRDKSRGTDAPRHPSTPALPQAVQGA